MIIPSTDVIHSTRLTGSFFLLSDVISYLNYYDDANIREIIREISEKVVDLPTYSFEKSTLIKKEDLEKILENTPKFFRQMECEVVTILFTRFGNFD
jgi:hypothetical protein